MIRNWVVMGAVLAGISVGMGAFAAHGLDSYFKTKYPPTEVKEVAGYTLPASYKYLQDFKTGAEYQMYHAVALIIVGLLTRTRKSPALEVAGWSFLIGIFLFSGALYVLTLSGLPWLGAIAPFGGTAFIVGWAALAIGATSPKVQEV